LILYDHLDLSGEPTNARFARNWKSHVLVWPGLSLGVVF
jgi:hypothetical protein